MINSITTSKGLQVTNITGVSFPFAPESQDEEEVMVVNSVIEQLQEHQEDIARRVLEHRVKQQMELMAKTFTADGMIMLPEQKSS